MTTISLAGCLLNVATANHSKETTDGRIQKTSLRCAFRIDSLYHSGENGGDLRDRGNIDGRMRCRRSDRPGCDLNDVVAHSIEHEFADGMQAEFAHDVAAMRLCRLYAEVQVNCNFFCRFAFSQQLYDLALYRRQVGQDVFLLRSVGTAIAGKHHFGNARGEEGLVKLESLDGGEQISSSVRLQQKTTGACIENRAHCFIRVSDRQDQDSGLRILTQNLACRLQSVERGHANIQ